MFILKTLRNLFHKTRTPNTVFTLAEFQQMVVSATKLQFPEVILTTPQEGEIHFVDNEVNGIFYLRNAYRDYLVAPQRLDEIANRLVGTIQDNRNAEPGTLRQNLMPVIKNATFINGYENVTGGMPFYEAINDELRILYVEDHTATISYITRKGIQEAGIKLTEVRAIAMENLARRMKDNIEITQFEGINMITADGTYEPSLILLPELFQDKRLQFSGDPVIAIPARGVLMVTGSEDQTSLLIYASMIAQEYPYPISPDLFQLSAGKWNYLYGLNGPLCVQVNNELVPLY